MHIQFVFLRQQFHQHEQIYCILFHLCDHRNPVRSAEGYREGSCAYASYLRRCVFFENPVAFYSRPDIPGN